MNKERRARMIINHVENRDERWGRSGPPRSDTTDKPTRIISDDPRLSARVTREHQTGPDGQPWDLVEPWVYGQHRMTAIYRGDELEIRVFKPGPWEPIFTIISTHDETPILSNYETM